MRNFPANKFLITTLSLLGVVALLGLAIGLRSMPFREAQAFGKKEAGTAGEVSLELIDAVLSIPIKTQILIWSLFVALLLLISLFLSPEMRKWLLRVALRTAATYWLLYILATRYREALAQIVLNLSPAAMAPAATSNGAPPPVFTPPAESVWLSLLIAFVIAVTLVLVVWKGYAIWRELNPPPASPINKLAKIARSSLNDLSSGRDSTDVIMNCYYRMSDVVAEKKRIDRRESMTPAEFAIRLEQAGLPGDAVKRLTRLFETVRYGGQKTNSTMVNEAVACLTTILHSCGDAV